MKAHGFHGASLLRLGDLRDDFFPESPLPDESSVVIGFFPLDGSRDSGLIAPFARKNHYKEIIRRLKLVLKEGGESFRNLSKRELRFFSNSRFREKDLALLGGLGFRGRNTLLITPGCGSRGVLGGMIFPVKLEPGGYENKTDPALGCGSCRLCEKACPGGALLDYRLNRRDCLQHWCSTEGVVPDRLKDVWGKRIYGCTICQDCCPWNRKSRVVNRVDLGAIEPEPPLDFYLKNSPEEQKRIFRGTALGMNWIRGEELTRNAIISAAHGGDWTLKEMIEGFQNSEDEGIRDAAAWYIRVSGQTGDGSSQ